jgi:hypothetical protein
MSEIIGIHDTKQVVDPYDITQGPDAPENFGPAKISAWDKDTPAGTEERDNREGADRPSWDRAFRAGSIVIINNYECQVLQVGYAGGRWMVLVEPQRLAGRPSVRRAEKSVKKVRRARR